MYDYGYVTSISRRDKKQIDYYMIKITKDLEVSGSNPALSQSSMLFMPASLPRARSDGHGVISHDPCPSR